MDYSFVDTFFFFHTLVLILIKHLTSIVPPCIQYVGEWRVSHQTTGMVAVAETRTIVTSQSSGRGWVL